MKKIVAISAILFLTASFLPPFTQNVQAVGEFDKGMVSLSFDDGTKSIFTNGIPILNAAGLVTTQFIISGAMECADGGVGCSDYMTSSDLQTLYAAGHEIAAHTRTDPCPPAQACETGVGLTGLPEKELLFEIDGLRQDLLASIGVPVNTFAYPFGEFDNPLTEKLKSAGIVGARTVNLIDAQGQVLLNDKTSDRYHLFAGQVNGSTPITPDDPDPEGFGSVQEWIDLAIAQDKWLILVFHEIDPLCPLNGFCTTPDELSEIADYLASKSAEELAVVTIGEGLAQMDNHPTSDSVPPTITQGNINVTTASASGQAVSFTPVVTDNDTNLSATLNAFCTIEEPRYPVSEFPPFGGHPIWGVQYDTVVASGDNFPLGTTTVNCTATDTAGNVGTHSFDITVTQEVPAPDTVPPTIEQHEDVTATATSSDEIIVNFINPLAQDAVDGEVPVTCDPSSGSLFAIGTTTVECTAQDSSSNTATSSFSVIVTDDRDITPPTITLLGDSEVTVTKGDGYIDAGATAEDDIDGNITDLIIIDNPVQTATTGTYVITYNVSDSAGNAANEVTRTVIVSDQQAPTPPPPSGGGSGGGGGGGGGGSFNPILPNPSPSGNTGGEAPDNGEVLGEQTTSHPHGTLILDSGTIYRIENGTKRPFRNSVEFLTYGYKFTDVVPANPGDLILPTGQILKAMEGTLVLDSTDGRTVYMIGQNGVKRGFTSEEVFRGLGYTFRDLVRLNTSDYTPGPVVDTISTAHPEGSLVKDAAGTVWWVLGETRRPFPSSAIFHSYGLKFANVVSANQYDLALPANSAIAARQ